ncbi:putative HAT dimerization domain-containing protein [Rosa chinensis]|uniref:Putative HAT dimerization domain-containing protein n=1 Tax=Rosa chinensis TaxID=74649 RepID=A0A2P6R676_ROSCH|nr:putative HAT dimerization domain-containing protein [Rosa chinensis]
MFPRKQLSGSQKRKRKKREEEIIQSQRGSLDKYFVKETNESVEDHVENLVNEPELQIHSNEFVENQNEVNEEPDDIGENESDETENNENLCHDEIIANKLECLKSSADLNIFDPRVWDSLDSKMRDLLVEKGPITETNINFPKDELEQQSAQESFRTDYFLILVDMALSQLKSRFEQMKTFESIFGFLFDASKLAHLDDDELKSHCLNLENALRKGDGSDIDAKYLLMELQILQEMLPNEAYETDRPWTSIQIMEFAKKMDMFPSVMVAYRILLTIPVTVASAERSFSKLKLLKSYLRTTMTQDRLNGLAMLTIERNMLANVDYKKMIDDFASRNARRHHFR